MLFGARPREQNLTILPHLCYIMIGEGTCLKEVHSISFGQLEDELQNITIV